MGEKLFENMTVTPSEAGERLGGIDMTIFTFRWFLFLKFVTIILHTFCNENQIIKKTNDKVVEFAINFCRVCQSDSKSLDVPPKCLSQSQVPRKCC